MSRVRLSTTVDGRTLATARRLFSGTDSSLLDEALAQLVERLEAEHEAAVLTRFPYEDDPDLAWQAPPGPDLPYDGEVPIEVTRLIEERSRAR